MSGRVLSPLYLTAWGLLALGGVMFLSLLVRAIRALWRRFRPLNVWARYAQEASPYRRRRGRIWGCLGTILFLLLSLLLAGSGWGLLRLEEAVQVYTAFPPDEDADNVAARVQCIPTAEELNTKMICSVTSSTSAYTTTIEGVRWALEGELLVWDPVLESFGLRSGYRLLRLLGYGQGGRVVASTALVADSGGLEDWLWRLDDNFPFVYVHRDVAHGEAAEEAFYELTVSRSGFSLQQWGAMEP